MERIVFRGRGIEARIARDRLTPAFFVFHLRLYAPTLPLAQLPRRNTRLIDCCFEVHNEQGWRLMHDVRRCAPLI